ncbi:MAG: pirin family protein [Acidobacteriota bacterium]
MIEVRKSAERGHADHGWLRSAHSFSFADYHDPKHMGFGPLRVINEDRVAPGQGFGTHPHHDMEIISYVLSGALEHKDSMGTGSVLHYGAVQRISAGRGITHSEFNHSPAEPVHFLQIWISPNVQGITPSYEEKHFEVAAKIGHLRLIASPDGHDDSVLIHQDAYMYAAILDGTDRAAHQLAARRCAYVQVARGQVAVNGTVLAAGDGAKISEVGTIVLDQARDAEILLFDLH